MTARRPFAVPVAQDEMPAPDVSVIIPAYNSAASIERCLACLAVQDTPHRFEVIVVDSGTDDTCVRARRALPAVRAVRTEKRLVAAAARNLGASLARGRILAFLDSDAYADHHWVSTVVDAANSGADLVCGSIENANPGSAVSRAEQLIMFNEFPAEGAPRPSWFALSGNMVLTDQAFERFGPFLEVRAAEDVVFSRRLLAAGGRILFFPSLRVFHDNRTALRRFLRNQVTVGRHTAMARRLVSFADTGSYAAFLLLLPVAPFAKTAKIGLRLARRGGNGVRRLAREFPLFFLGVCAYSVGMVRGVLAAGMRKA